MVSERLVEVRAKIIVLIERNRTFDKLAGTTMNRQKKIKQALKKITKKLNAKKQPKKKSTYICKAERAALQAKENLEKGLPPE